MLLKKEYTLAGISVLCWGTVATVTKILAGQLDAMFALAFSFLFASLFLFLYNWKQGNLSKLRRTSKGTLMRMVGIGSLGVLFYNLFLLLGEVTLPAQVAFLINDLWPALIIVFSCIILKEKFTIAKLVAIVFSILGIFISTSNGDFGFLLHTSMQGVIFCAMAAICYGLYCTLNKREDYDKGISVFVSYLSGSVIAFIWVFATGKFHLPDVPETIAMAFNGIIANALPYLTWAMALDLGNTAIIANLAYLTPFVSLGVTHFILGEKVTAYSFLGLFLIIAGIGLQMYMQEGARKRTARQLDAAKESF
ncbi:MAG: DMT family transporter [Lachnospiraceae bacterium]|jgi:drug/metabolite transporter (DMT)-like permease|nr:DMT family transporter [Lachnospiraceae bacterium]